MKKFNEITNTIKQKASNGKQIIKNAKLNKEESLSLVTAAVVITGSAIILAKSLIKAKTTLAFGVCAAASACLYKPAKAAYTKIKISNSKKKGLIIDEEK